MNKRILTADLLLLLTAAVWGFGFVAQRFGMQYVGPFTYNMLRFPMACLTLLPVIFLSRRHKLLTQKKMFILSSLLAGTCLFFAGSLQQMGIMATTAGNAGFITGLYVIFTPVFGIFLGRSTGKATWFGAVLTLAGLYFLSTAGPLNKINSGDILVAVSAVFWAIHVLIIDRLVQKIDPLLLSVGQFAFSGLYALIAAFTIEPLLSAWLNSLGPEILPPGLFTWRPFPVLFSGFRSGTLPVSLAANAAIPILYGGVAAVGIGYTLQVVAQKNAPPAHATIILCLEGCFAALGGILILHEAIGGRTIIGFSLMLLGMFISQWELIRGNSQK